MELSAKPMANPAVIFQEQFDRWAVLVNLDTADSVTISPTGVVVWQLVDGKRTVQEIIAAVQDQFDDAPPTVANDVVELLDTLAEKGFVSHK
jgi:hypothetical protein